MGLSGIFLYLVPKLPAVDSLLDIKLHTPLRIYTNDGELIGEFGEKRRTPVAIEHVPKTFKLAFLAAEDDQFYVHSGISYKGLSRAILQMISGSRQQSGGSTITQQVAKNYFLTPEKTIIRKLREIFLAIQIENELSKEKILELYVNKIFLGHKSYGISAAAQTYYGKTINDLSIAEMAMIAGLPKAPSAYNPISNPERAHLRRDWIIGRMHSLGYISQADMDEAINTPLTAQRHNIDIDVAAPYVAEMIRLEAKAMLGDSIYSDGYSIYTTINGKMQHNAQQTIEKG
ncbi:MAG: transglycosylase domain-containing protein, partial [Sinobacterium sp.]|nr:transglycosylase domain-containing protein [Sinobacterium sp.]